MKIYNSIFSRKYISVIIIFLLIVSLPKEIEAQFAYGADVSWLSQMENSGRIFKDNSGIQKDCLDILKVKGINALRFRVWVNPANNFNNKKDVASMALRAKNKGFDVMIDFHMSDTWADPGHQTKPAAWSTHSFSQLQNDVYDHVYSVLDTLKSIGVTPKWVQIGNETNDGMLWPDGKASTSSATMSNFAALIKSGYNAVKAIDNSIQVIVQLSNGYDNNMYKWIFQGLKDNGAKWDIIGMSAYPYGSTIYPSWINYDGMVQINMGDLINRYNTKIMVCEVGYPYNQPDVAKSFLSDLIAHTKTVGGLGVFYWEPEAYNWQNYSLGAWDPATYQPTIALDAFREANPNPLSVKEDKIITNYELNIYPNPFNPSTTIQYTIPEASKVSIIINDIIGREVAKLEDDFKITGNYSLNWTANKIPSGIYFCRMISQKYIVTKKIVLIK